jgi:hypothetical protein
MVYRPPKHTSPCNLPCLSYSSNAETHIGGAKSRSRIYPRIVVNQPTPMFEYSDLSMKELPGAED